MLGIDESHLPHKTCLDRRLLPGLTTIVGVEELCRGLVCLWDCYPRHGSGQELCGTPWGKKVACRGNIPPVVPSISCPQYRFPG